MRPLESDILEFVHQQFQPEVLDKVVAVLGESALLTPRVQRAVLFLSGGSLPMLKHYAESAKRDARQVLERAEYVLGAEQTPPRLREFVAPVEQGQSAASEVTGTARRKGSGPLRASARPTRRPRCHGDQIKGAGFHLGKARYVVMGEPGDDWLVPCIRRCDNVITLMRLPLLFVVEQISEHIDLADVGG